MARLPGAFVFNRSKESKRFRFDDKKENKKSGIEVANNEQYLMVLGAPGAGKSTFLRKTGLEALKGKDCQYKHPVIPVFLELKRFTQSEFFFLCLFHIMAYKITNKL